MRISKFTSQIIMPALFMVWLTGILAVYYVVHRPFLPPHVFAFLDALQDITLATLLVCLSGGIGLFLLHNFPGLHAHENAALQVAFGLGGVGLLVLIAGLAGLWVPWVGWGSLITGLVVFRKSSIAWLRLLWQGIESWNSQPFIGKLSAIFVGFVLLVNLTLALAPPTQWDSLVYHLELPQQYIAHGGITFILTNLYSGFPQLAEMWFGWAMILHSPATAAVLGWWVGAIALMGVGSTARRIFPQSSQWLAPAILLTGVSISHALHWAYVDLWGMLFGLCTWIALLMYFSTSKKGWLLVAGVQIGFGISVKYSAGIVLPVAILLCLVNGLLETPVRKSGSLLASRGLTPSWLLDRANETLALAGIAFLICLPWLVKNLVFTGQPLYPVSLGEVYLDPWQQTFQRDPLDSRSIWNDIFLPVEATLFGIEGAQVQAKLEYGASLGPLLLALTPGILLGWLKYSPSQKKVLKLWLLAAAGGWLIWVGAARYANELMWPRHYYGFFPVFAFLAIAGMMGVLTVRVGKVRLSRIMGGMVILALALSGFSEIVFWIERNPLTVISGVEGRDAYLERTLGAYFQAMQAVNQLPEGAKVLFLWEPRTFYCHAICLPDATLDNWWYLTHTGRGVSTVAREISNQGITHVLIYEDGLNWMQYEQPLDTRENWELFREFRESCLEEQVNIAGHYGLYELKHCQQGIEG